MISDPEKGVLANNDEKAVDSGAAKCSDEVEDNELKMEGEASLDLDSARSQPSSTNQIEPVEVEATRSIASSTGQHSISIVPRVNRRGLLAKFACIPEVDRPYEYRNRSKWFITALVALAAAVGPMSSSIFLPALPEIAGDLNTTPTITNLSVAMYMLSMAVFPLWWSSFSETLGRRTIYLVSFALYTLFSITSAISTSIGMLIVMRILAGGAAASVQSVGAGTIADIWEFKERGRAMGVYYLGPLMGPLLSPITGGALAERWGWRSTQWFQAIYGGMIVVTLTLCLPETLSITRQTANLLQISNSTSSNIAEPTPQAIPFKTAKSAQILKRCIISPLTVLTHLRHPPILLTVYLASITFCSLYILNISIQATFSASPYNYTSTIIGLLYIPNSVGYVLSSIFGGRWNDIVMHRSAISANRYDTSGKLFLRTEERMQENAWFAAALYPSALIMYGWTAQKGVIWIVPMIANFFFGVGSMVVFGVATTMLTEMLYRRSSSGVAVNNFVRNIFGCVGGVVAEPLINVMGNGWLFTGLGVVCFVSSFGVVWGMRRCGRRWMGEMEGKIGKGEGR